MLSKSAFIKTISGSLIAVALGLSGCADLKSLKFAGIEKLSLQPVSLASSDLKAEILVYNPNKRKIYVERWNADIIINGRQLASHNSDSSFILAALDTLRYPLSLSVSNIGLLGGALDFVGGKRQYRIKGNARAGTRALKINMPFDETGELKF